MILRDLLRLIFAPRRPAPTPPPSGTGPVPPSNLTAVRAYEVLGLVNHSRGGQLAWDEDLATAAARHAQAMAVHRRLTHAGFDGRDFAARVHAINPALQPLGEVVAWGQETAGIVVSDWMRSPGHRDALLDPHATRIGVAVCRSTTGEPYWCGVTAR